MLTVKDPSERTSSERERLVSERRYQRDGMSLVWCANSFAAAPKYCGPENERVGEQTGCPTPESKGLGTALLVRVVGGSVPGRCVYRAGGVGGGLGFPGDVAGR